MTNFSSISSTLAVGDPFADRFHQLAAGDVVEVSFDVHVHDMASNSAQMTFDLAQGVFVRLA